MSGLTQKQSLCISCQYCCKYLSFTFISDEIGIEFYRARGLKIIHSTDDDKTYVLVPHVCPQLTTQGCKIYSTRPQICRSFDGSKHPVSSKVCPWPKK